MKRSELRQMIREEYRRVINEASGMSSVDAELSKTLDQMNKWIEAASKAGVEGQLMKKYEKAKSDFRRTIGL